MDQGPVIDLSSDVLPSAADDGTAVFAAPRRRLAGIAYRIIGSLADAEDVVQEAWLRFSKARESETIERPAAWLTTVVARIALDHLKAARQEREVYVGPWLPEPIAGDPLTLSRPGPEEMVELSSSLTIGFLHVLETLNPVERVVFILADVFDVSFKEIAETVGKTPDACRAPLRDYLRRLRRFHEWATDTRDAARNRQFFDFNTLAAQARRQTSRYERARARVSACASVG